MTKFARRSTRRNNAIDPARTVVDTNVFISAAVKPAGISGKVMAAALRHEFDLIATDEHARELRRVSERGSVRSRYPLDRALLAAILAFLQTVELIADLTEPPVHCRDPKDDYLLACTVAGRADYLVTGDRDLLALDGDPALGALRILTPAAFLAALDARTTEA